jgi:outer membrane lipoprotein-sorting protein
MKILIFTLLALLTSTSTQAQEDAAKKLVQKIKAKYDKVTDYEADGKMKTNVVFIKAPIAKIKVYYKKPNKLKIKNESGVSFVPKGSVNINMADVFESTKYQALDAGVDKVNGTAVKVVKILPDEGDKSDLVLATLYIDETNLLVLKSKTTTKDNGSYELTMKYGDYASYGLPKSVEFQFNTKDYKLPKGVTFDYDNGSGKDNAKKPKPKKGKLEITYSSYKINKGLSDDTFNK